MTRISHTNLCNLDHLINDEMLEIDKFEQSCVPVSLAEAKEILNTLGKLRKALIQANYKVCRHLDEENLL